MSQSLTCAVIASALARESVDRAMAYGLGDFSSVEFYTDLDQDLHADWVLYVDPQETVRTDIFITAAPALRLHDAVWGAVSLYKDDKEIEHVVRKSRLACQSFEEFFHLALKWWIGPSYFIKTKLFSREASSLHLLLILWQKHKCFKTAQPLTIRQNLHLDLTSEDREFLVSYLDQNPIFRTVHGREQDYKLPYTGRNPVIERDQTRGQFYEEDELKYLESRVPTGSVIVDVGANTGNHTVYFSQIMKAKKVIPIEPMPTAITALKRAIEINQISNVDLSKLGIGVGQKAGTFCLKLSQTGGLGATSLKQDAQGDVQVLPLDDLINEPIDVLKIDVESMEMQALAGASVLIQTHRPLIYIEIADENSELFLNWIDHNTYQIEKIFPDKTHANYLISPDRGDLDA